LSISSPKKGIANLLCASLSLLVLIPTTCTAATTTGAAQESHFQRAVKELQNFQCGKAIIACQKAMFAHPNLPQPRQRTFRARLFTVIGQAFRFDENDIAAAQAFSVANALTPGDPDIQACLADALERSGQRQKAAPIIEKMAKMSSASPFQLMTLSLHYSRSGDEESAGRFIDQALSAEHNNSHLLLLKARNYVRRGLTDQAMREFAVAGEAEPVAYMSNIYQAMAGTMTDRKASETFLERAGQLLPEDPLWHVYLADSFAATDRPKAAFDQFMAALNSARLCTRAYRQAATYLSQNKRLAEALACLDHIAKLRPYCADIFACRATILEKSGQRKKAIEALQHAIQLDPYSIGAYTELARYQKRDGATATAIQTLRQGLALVPADVRAWHDLADLEWSVDPARAKPDYAQVLALTKNTVAGANVIVQSYVGGAHAAFGTQYYLDKQTDKALAEAKVFNQYKFVPNLPLLLRAMTIRPGRMKPGKTKVEQQFVDHVMLGAMLLETRRLDECIAEYQTAASINPNDIDIHSYLLDAYTEKNDWLRSAQEDLVLSNKIVVNVPSQVKRMMGK